MGGQELGWMEFVGDVWKPMSMEGGELVHGKAGVNSV